MKPMLFSVFFVSIVVFAVIDAVQAEPAAPSWELADQVYTANMKQYKLNKWEDSAIGFEGFIKDFSSSQDVPLAYLQLAHCYLQMGDKEKCLQTLEKLLAKFPDSYAATFACGHILLAKYDTALEAVNNEPPVSADDKKKPVNKQFDDFIKFLTSLESRYGGLYQSPDTRLDWRRPGDYWYFFSLGRTLWYPHYRVTGARINLYPLSGWNYRTGQQYLAQKMLALAKDPAKAEAILKALDPCFKRSIPASWKVMRAKLEAKTTKGEKAASDATLKKYLGEYDKDDPFSIGLKSILLKDAWDSGDMESVKKYSNELIDSFAGFEDIYYPFTRWMDYVYNTGDSKEFIRLSKLYMQKNPTGDWRENVIDRWISLAERGAVKPAETLAMIDAEIATCPKNNPRVKKYLFKKISVLMAAKNQKEAVEVMKKILQSREYWSKSSFEEATKYAGIDPVFAPLIKKARSTYFIPELKSDSPARTTYDDLQFRISQGQVRHMEELADKLYNQYRRDGYAIQGLRDLVHYFYSKAMHKYRDKWADIMISAYPLNPETQDVLEWQIKAANSVKDFKMLAKYTDIAMKSFPGADDFDSWIKDRLASYDTVKELDRRIKHANSLLKTRADSAELAALELLGEYECSALDTPTKQCSYWCNRAGQFKGKLAEVYCYVQAYEYGYTIPIGKWTWNTVDFKGVAKASDMIGSQKFNDGWRWKYKYDSINVLSQGNLGAEAAKEAIKLIPELKSKTDISSRIDLPNFGRALASAKLQDQAASLFAKLAAMCNESDEKFALNVMKANVCRFAGMDAQAARGYLTASKYYKQPVERWQTTMHAASSVNGIETAKILFSYSKQLKTAQDCIPGMLERVFDIYTKDKKVKLAVQIVGLLKKSYEDSAAYGSVIKKASAKPEPPKKKKQS